VVESPDSPSLAPTSEQALRVLPDGLRTDLINAFNEIVRNHRERRWEPAELNGGKLCEAAYTIIRGRIDGTYAARANKPRDILRACRDLEQEGWHERSVKIQIPRMITALYEIRNNRGVGHAGGDVNPNLMDSTAVLYMAKWIVAEIVRVLHTATTEDATRLVESLVERQIELIYTSGSVRRVLDPKLTWKQKMLLLMISVPGEVQEADLLRWIEHPNLARLRRDILRPAHKAKLIEYDEVEGILSILPPGIEAAEALL
jgi:hypothetical protein